MGNFESSVDFSINELYIVTKTGEKIDISNLFDEINLYDSMLVPVMSGKVVITDALGIYGRLHFDGSESILVDIQKSVNFELKVFKKAYRIYKVTNKHNLGLNAQRYVLHFVSDELIYSDQQRVNYSYEMTYTQIVQRILTDYLKIPGSQMGGIVDESMGIRKVVVPNLKPIEALIWCSKRAVDSYNSPNFIFFQNSLGYNFASLTTLLPQKEILDIKFELQNTKELTPILGMFCARSLQLVDQMDAVNRIRTGVDAGKFVGFDPLTRMIETRDISYNDHFDSMSHGNPLPSTSEIQNREKKTNLEMFDSRKSLSVFSASRQFSKYIQKYDPTSISLEDDSENYKFQRLAILQNLVNRRVRAVMPGNFQLTSGLNVNLIAPNFAFKQDGVDSIDKSLSGKYIILSTRHIIGYNKQETLIELASSSSNDEYVPKSSYKQTELVME